MSKKYATRLLRRNPAIPKDFRAIAVVRADARTVQKARQTLRMDKPMAALFVAVFFPLAVPLVLLKREMKAISERLTAGAEDDVYVLGTEGFATINKGRIKSWIPSSSMYMEIDTEMFHTGNSGLLWQSSGKKQPVLVVNDSREGYLPQLAFLNKKDLRKLLSRSRYKYVCDDISYFSNKKRRTHRDSSDKVNMRKKAKKGQAKTKSAKANLPKRSIDTLEPIEQNKTTQGTSKMKSDQAMREKAKKKKAKRKKATQTKKKGSDKSKSSKQRTSKASDKKRPKNQSPLVDLTQWLSSTARSIQATLDAEKVNGGKAEDRLRYI